MERELFFDVPAKTSVDSGVETGNDSNDSHTTFDSQSIRREFNPREFRSFEINIPQPLIKNPSMNTSREQANGSVESKAYGNIKVINSEGVILSVLGKNITQF
jgi:hypothetical protein